MSGRKFAHERALKEPGHGLAPTELLVLRVLALWADSSGWAYPSVATVAEVAGVKARAVQRALTQAQKLGWIEAPDGRKGGARRTTHWRLAIPSRPDAGVRPEEAGAAGRGVTGDAPRRSSADGRGVSRVTPRGVSRRQAGVSPGTPEVARGSGHQEVEEISGEISCGADAPRASARPEPRRSSQVQGRRDGAKAQ